jgi:hypothetical protein
VGRAAAALAEAAAMRVALVAAALAVALGTGPATAAPLVVRTSLSPSPARFGDVIVATVAVTPDGTVDPGSIDVRPGLAPYGALGEPARSSAGGTVSFRYDVSCITEACIPPRIVRLAPARVTATTRADERVDQAGAWPSLTVRPRVSKEAVDRVEWRQQLSPASPTYRVRPGLLAAVLAGAAVLLVAGAAALVAVELRRRRRAIALADPRLPLERALALLRESTERPPADRRKALSLVSHEVPAAERVATALAWSRRPPDAERVGALADELEQGPAAP